MNPEAVKAVGAFDSGVGGLTVVGAIQRLLPRENLIYLGDCARLPYGNKSPETIIRYSEQNAEFLLNQGVKAIVVACNTATAHALPSLQAHFRLPILGVITPGVEAALAATRTHRIGIIGTRGTIASGAYQKALLARRPELQIIAIETPLLVPLVEEDWLSHGATHLVLAEYLQPLLGAKIDTLVLACTHYPLLKATLAKILGPDVKLVDSAENMAGELARLLRARGLEQPNLRNEGQVDIHVSDLPSQFSALAQRFLGTKPRSVEKFTYDC